ncbi:hypothetical protein PR202_gb23089 [Eleusine coracana subsp. coracana]|uniref:non-specific serine/threonine protein kinase n=1 Tax=Eleusine coracana subsp. coracana TaxID=191504 RepID=A0AAV5FHX7_ELECO|nr:hypothetical protein PR202_gb23089 [Eleusine coracana subsp. coracana]
MVKTWTEKEMRNLLRVRTAGIRCPVPLLLRLHVLVMEFIGKGGWAAPRFKDVALSDDKLRESYFEGHLYIIDVSQSVDLDHPSALDFLKEDCLHVSDFFKKRGVAVMSVTDLFNFVVDQNIANEHVDDYLEKTKNTGADEKQQEQLRNKCSLENRVEDDEDDSGSCSSFDEDGLWHEADPKMGPEERKAARKENKKKVKEEKREACKTKIPKAEKKRKKMAKAKCKR